MDTGILLRAVLIVFLLAARPGRAAITSTNFFNFENNPVHPVDLSPDGTHLAVCNVGDDRLEILSLTSGLPVSLGSVTVGLEPVSVRFRTTNELWVANYVSSSISIVNLAAMQVTATITTSNQPADIVFAGFPAQAWVSCDRPNLVQVFNVSTWATVTNLVIDGNRPRAMAVSPGGGTIYVAIFESGNASTIIGSGISPLESLPRPEPVSFPNAPSGGADPPPNDGSSFNPPINPALSNTPPPRTGLIVKKNSAGHWMDDNDGDWTEFITGTNAALTGRLPGWDMPDHDLAVINSTNYSVNYATGLMNICMAVGINPVTGQIAVVGTDSINQIRFQPVLDGIFVRVEMALVDPATLTSQAVDLNPQLNYQTPVVSASERALALGDPRGIVWSADGSTGYVTGMGSGNLILVDSQGNRIGTNGPINLGQGPTGIALDEVRDNLYIYNRFDGSISTVSVSNQTVTATLTLFDPTPSVIKTGRPFLYNTQLTSGLGQASCASCHVDARFDGLAWDLGDPTSTIGVIDSTYNFAEPFPAVTNNYHPMKGPMVTLTLQDIIGHEPFHWRGDRAGIEDFNIAFTNLQAMPGGLNTNEMAELKSFLGTVGFGPNPYRPINNTLSTNLALPGLFVLGRGTLPAGAPLPNGNASNGLATFRDESSANGCVLCHTLPTGLGADMQFNGTAWVQIPPGTNSDHHIQLSDIPRSDNLPFKIPQLRNLFDKTGMDLFHTSSRSGFGFSHDGSVDSLVRFVQDSFALTNDQETADLTAFLFSFTGSDLPAGSRSNPDNAPGVASLDVPAAVGLQTTLTNPAATGLANTMISLAAADTNLVDLVVKGTESGLARGWYYIRSGGYFQSDRMAETETPAELAALASPSTPLTYTIVPSGSGERIGVDRDADGYFDRDELDAGYNPANAASVPPLPPPEIGGLTVSAGGAAVTVGWNAVNGLVCELQYKNQLSDPSWTSIATNTAGIGLTTASDTTFSSYSTRFYRIRSP
jgi:YVTN family beta-propeller protein